MCQISIQRFSLQQNEIEWMIVKRTNGMGVRCQKSVVVSLVGYDSIAVHIYKWKKFRYNN